ncbi:MAG: glycoside hydrolase family 2 protein [Clostridiales bacterium]|nr:glycoside hydrolase family 2 protein [Clostridiales bacterium]
MFINLNGQWAMRNVTQDAWIPAAVPGTVFSDLLAAGLATDPYYRGNEDEIQPLLMEDYEYVREFEVSESHLKSDEALLRFEGLDTLADVYLNETLVAKTGNMHRTYELDAKELLVPGKNKVRVVFHSARKFIQENASLSRLPSVLGNHGVEQIRKAQCQFGWDWGLSLPDMGIWRDASLVFRSVAMINSFYFTQKHQGSQSAVVELKASVDIRKIAPAASSTLTVRLSVKGPEGEEFSAICQENLETGKYEASIAIERPKLWWPNGYGDQPLYQATIALNDGDVLLESKTASIGLRTLELRREEDEWGKSYEFVVNGKAIFLRGSNLIIEDSLLTRNSKERTEKMLRNSVLANFNCVRVWGGAIYPDDCFYDACDRLGLIVYQDFMFACHAYPVREDFLQSVKEEIKDNVKRIRHHACLGLWSGNNEIETIIEMFTSPEPMFAGIKEYFNFSGTDEEVELMKSEYLELFCHVVPDLLKELDPNTSYTRSSPATDIPFVRDENRGDSHFYAAFVKMPYRKQRELFFRFVSEMGFQSYPSIKTINSFTEPEDRWPNSPVMLKHQKSNKGNEDIEKYMAQDFKVPEDFGLYVYASQILAGEILKLVTEHLRRSRGRCMGMITWQLNDCWPAVSWAGLDYCGRWKAQQYYSKRFYAPVLVSIAEEGKTAEVHVTNDTFEEISGALHWALKDNTSVVIEKGEFFAAIAPLSSKRCLQLDFSSSPGFNPRTSYLECSLASECATAIFVPAKEFLFLDPCIAINASETNDSFTLEVSARCFAKSVGLDLSEADCVFSDNYFDLSADVKTITVSKSSLSSALSLERFKTQLTVSSLFDVQQC